MAGEGMTMENSMRDQIVDSKHQFSEVSSTVSFGTKKHCLKKKKNRLSVISCLKLRETQLPTMEGAPMLKISPDCFQSEAHAITTQTGRPPGRIFPTKISHSSGSILITQKSDGTPSAAVKAVTVRIGRSM